MDERTKQNDTETTAGHIELPEPIPGFNEFGHIPLEKLHNTRDLGGLPAADGRRIRPAQLLRSGCLHKASEQDIATLLADYRLEGVVDFRTAVEAAKSPTRGSSWKAWCSTTSRLSAWRRWALPTGPAWPRN